MKYILYFIFEVARAGARLRPSRAPFSTLVRRTSFHGQQGPGGLARRAGRRNR